MNVLAGMAKPIRSSYGGVALEAWSEAMAGTDTSPMRNVSAAVVPPEVTVLRNTRKVVMTPVVGADATDMNLTRSTKLPLAPAVNALKMSVASVPVPSDLVLAEAVVMVARPTLGVRVKIGLVFAGIVYLT
jgi:hypothetical protein